MTRPSAWALLSLLVVCCLTGAEATWSSWTSIWRALVPNSPSQYLPQACDNLFEYYAAHLVGQELVLNQLAAAVCEHVQNQHSAKPLVLILSGPPGVGKSETTRITAKALYTGNWQRQRPCVPQEADCPSYLVFSGMSYTQDDQERAIQAMLDILREHTRRFPQSLIVFEDIDKLSCYFRNRFRDVIDHPSAYNVRLHRAVIMMTTNIGTDWALRFSKELLTKGGKSSTVDMEALLSTKLEQQCTDANGYDIEQQLANQRFVTKIDRFLAYHLLTQEHIADLFGKLLQAENNNRQYLPSSRPLLQRLHLEWDSQFLQTLVQHSGLTFSDGFSTLGGARCRNALNDKVLYKLRSAAARVKCQPDARALRLSINAKTGETTAQCVLSRSEL